MQYKRHLKTSENGKLLFGFWFVSSQFACLCIINKPCNLDILLNLNSYKLTKNFPQVPSTAVCSQ